MSVRTLRPLLQSFTHTTPLSRPATLSSTTLIQQTSQQTQNHRQTRTFFSNPFASSTPSTLTASRTLPYPTLRVYDMISDIESYPAFIPYCSSATVTSWSAKDAHHARAWPQSATLTIGFPGAGGVQESFASRVFCVPPVPEKGRAGVGIVEAVSGEAESSGLDEGHIKHHDTEGKGAMRAPAGGESPLTYLKTRWTVTHFPFKPAPVLEGGKRIQDGGGAGAPEAEERTDIELTIEYKFANPMYEMMSKAVAGKVADKMIEAFEKRAAELLGRK